MKEMTRLMMLEDARVRLMDTMRDIGGEAVVLFNPAVWQGPEGETDSFTLTVKTELAAMRIAWALREDHPRITIRQTKAENWEIIKAPPQ